MIKTINPADYNWDEPIAQLVKTARRGLTGDDRRTLEKRASNSLISQFDSLSFGPGELPVHLYALGTTEAVGPNRNYDGFPKAACRKYHDTFVKHARWYREHFNKDESKSYGVVKASAFNEAMQRIELIVGLNSTKEAAQRNRGLVADEELEKLASGKPLGVSMSVIIPYDTCSYCGNTAKCRKEYCRSESAGGSCKAGGLAKNAGRILDDGSVLHMINDTGLKFFDISNVRKPADHIAYVTGQLQKAASRQLPCEYQQVPSLQLFLGDISSNHKQTAHIEAIHKLASMEHDLTVSPAKMLFVNGSTSTIPITKEAQDNPQKALKALSEVGGVLSLAGFLQLFGGQDAKEAAETAEYAADNLQDCFSSLLIDGDVASAVSNHPYTPASTTSPSLQKWAQSIADQVSFHPEDATARAMRASIHEKTAQENTSPLIKLAGVSNVVEQYAIYKSATVLDLFSRTSDIPLTASLILIQNRVK